MRITRILLAIAILSLINPVFANSDNKINIAIITDNTSGLDNSPLISVLEVELSKLENIKLLERNEIEKILAEKKLQLSFEATENESRKQIGTILGADVLIVITRNSTTEGDNIQIRIIETRTGIILGDLLQSDSNITDNIETFIEYIKITLNKTLVPIETRQYIGILGIESEEPGSELNSLASTLTALLTSSLNSSPQFVVLEREKLGYLILERNLTGIELELFSSSTLVRGGIRRSQSNESLVLTLSFTFIENQKTDIVSIDVQSNDPLSINEDIFNTICNSLNIKERLQSNISHEIEANIFAVRAKELMDIDIDQAIAFAESAIALNPTIEHKSLLFECSGLKWNEKSFPLIERLNSCKRANEVDLEIVKEIATIIKTEKNSRFNHFCRICGLNMHFQATPEQQKECNIISEIKSLCRKKYEILHEIHKDNGFILKRLLAEKMNHVFWLSETIDQFCDEIKLLIIEFENIPDEPMYKEDSSIIKSFCGNLSKHFNPELHRDYKNKIYPTIKWVSKQKNPLISIIGFYGLLYQDNQEGIDAAKHILDSLFFKSDDNLIYQEFLSNAIIKLQRAGIMENYFDDMLDKVEKESSCELLIKNADYILAFLNYTNEDNRTKWSQRILSLTKSYPTTELQKLQYEKYKEKLNIKTLPITDSLNNATNPWTNYNITSIPFPNRDYDIHNRLIWVQADNNSHEIVLAWRSARRKLEGTLTWFDYIFTRMDIQGGHMYQVGLLKELRGLSIICSTESPEYIFLGSKNRGLIVIDQEKVEIFSESEGCPSNNIKTMAYLDNYLYLGFDNCLARFDPQNNNFEIIASSKSVEKKSPLDAGYFYEFNTMLSDSQHGNLWLSISDYNYDRTGIWKYNPKNEEFTYFDNDLIASNMILNDTGELIFDHINIQTINTNTDTIAVLQNYSESALSTNSYKKVLMIGKDIINSGGWLYSDDGKKNKLDQYWTMLDRFGSGFIASYFHDTSAELWYVQPKNLNEQ